MDSTVDRNPWADDVLDTPSPLLRKKNRILETWPTPEMFKRHPSQTLKWRDIPLGVFGILGRKDLGRNDFGPSSKLHLLKQNGETLWVWAFERLLKALDRDPDTTHILNNGLVQSEFSDKKYFDFLLYTIHD